MQYGWGAATVKRRYYYANVGRVGPSLTAPPSVARAIAVAVIIGDALGMCFLAGFAAVGLLAGAFDWCRLVRQRRWYPVAPGEDGRRCRGVATYGRRRPWRPWRPRVWPRVWGCRQRQWRQSSQHGIVIVGIAVTAPARSIGARPSEGSRGACRPSPCSCSQSECVWRWHWRRQLQSPLHVPTRKCR